MSDDRITQRPDPAGHDETVPPLERAPGEDATIAPATGEREASDVETLPPGTVPGG